MIMWQKVLAYISYVCIVGLTMYSLALVIVCEHTCVLQM